MPRYDFVCATCKQRGAITIPIDEKLDTPICVECEDPMVRLYDPPAISFNGSGFYSTDK